MQQFGTIFSSPFSTIRRTMPWTSKNRVQRACRYATAAIGQTVSANSLEGRPDQLASVAERYSNTNHG